MQYLSFKIQNFKGIKDTNVVLKSITGASVFAFVGLNESGKTTILEAIHSFAPDEATSELLGGSERLGVPIKHRVPRHHLSDFTGDVSVSATLKINEEDIHYISSKLFQLYDIEIDWQNVPETIEFERKQSFANGDFKNNYFSIKTQINFKVKRQRKWRKIDHKHYKIIRDTFFERAPKIAYFPTFVFEFPKTVFLTDRGDAVDRFYRSVFQDILDYDGRGQTIDKDIIDRIRRKDLQLPWFNFWTEWAKRDDKDKIQQVVDRASAVVTKIVFGRWNKIFREEARGKEVVISFDPIQGEIRDEKGIKIDTNEHDVQVKFQIKDGTRRYDVNDRSLGFRWFFSFMLFTQFRVARSEANSVPLLFLFDEPAANLHSAAQQKLIESFPEIARDGHLLGYSTHSHYMIEPKWLEQTFIVTNRADTPSGSILDGVSLDDESLDIKVDAYRTFVNSHPVQTSYFQPILDRLDVVPSKFDIDRPSVVLEGRSDYYILRYAMKMLGTDEISLLPGLGAGTFGALAAIHTGWNLNFLFLLDGDKQGESERQRYRNEFAIPLERLITIKDLISNKKEIEDIVDQTTLCIIQNDLQLQSKPKKKQIMQFFQEKLASEQIVRLGEGFNENAEIIIKALSKKLASK